METNSLPTFWSTDPAMVLLNHIQFQTNRQQIGLKFYWLKANLVVYATGKKIAQHNVTINPFVLINIIKIRTT